MATKKMFLSMAVQNRDGNTAAIARKMLSGADYELLKLIDYKIDPLGQDFDDDEFNAVMKKMTDADMLVMGSPEFRNGYFQK